MSESDILAKIRLALGKRPDILLWRNQSGALKDENGRWVHFGLGSGSPDLVGILKVNGRGIFVGIEVKAPGAYTEPIRLATQKNWINTIIAYGGRAGFATSVQEAMTIIYGPKENKP